MDIFFEIGMLVIFAGIGSYLAKLLRQPLIPAYIVSGIIIGNVFSLVTNHELISNLSEMGIAFLLFMVGLEMEFRKIKDMGIVSLLAGTLQVAAVFIVGYFVSLLLGFQSIEAVYIGIVLAFSSTMIVIKILSDNAETDTLHGRLAIGILVVQDILAISALSYLTSVSSVSFGYSIMLKLAIIVGSGILLSKYVFPQIFHFAARSRELILSMALSVCFLFALLFYSLGLSITIGAFFAGVLLANLPYSIEIAGKVRPLRDFFSILFFTSLGLQLTFEGVGSLILPLIVLLVLVVMLKPVIIMLVLLAMKLKPRTSFITAASLAQVSEFSLIIVLGGVAAGVVPTSILTLTLLLAVFSMSFTSYFMSFESRMYRSFTSLLSRFRVDVSRSKIRCVTGSYDAILCGYDRIGYSVLKSLMAKKRNVMVVDFNPDIIRKLRAMGVQCIYGDVCDPEIMSRLDLENTRLLISTANDFKDNLLLLQKVKAANSHIVTLVTAHKIEEALELYKCGAEYVILPHFLGGEMVSQLIPDFEENQLQMLMHKYRHINDLVARRDQGHEHPTHLGY
ncbi:cation:proton antiporter [Candidatus Woesearchaeota archaeon]|nr:cation:proton antiporter [Candidatus Woesearchaeota archaeon]